ncbi:MAG: hypothetical protein QW474_00340 [Candidatus Aenigmatarchaeota archaeon]
MLYSVDWNKVFTRVTATVFVLLPAFLALFIFLWSPKNTIYSFFAILAETSLVAGIIANEEDTQMHSLMTIMGFFVSLILSTIFAWHFGFVNSIVNFLIYWWVWLSLYSAGINISLKYVDQNKLFESLMIVVGSIGTLSWYWFGFFF